MSPIHLAGAADCSAFDRVLSAYLDDELQASDREAIEAHLEACPPCARRASAEAAFDGALRRRLCRESLPEGLEAKVRARLAVQAGASSGPPAPRWRHVASATVLAAGVLLALALVPILAGRAPRVVAGREDVVRVHGEATVVDLVCDRRGVPFDRQRACRLPDHVNALRLADGTYWAILPSDAAAQARIAGPETRGRRIAFEGDFYPAIRAIAVSSVGDRAAAPLPVRSASGEDRLATLLAGPDVTAPSRKGRA